MEAFVHQHELLLQKEKRGMQTFPKEYEFVLCQIQCKECLNTGSTLIPVGDKNILHTVQHTQKQLDTQFNMGCCSVVAHNSHVNVPPHRSNQVVQMVFCPYSNGEVKYTLPIKPNATHFLRYHQSACISVLRFELLNYLLAESRN